MPRLFKLGRMLATPGALEAFEISGNSPLEYLQRHVHGDWSEMDAHDQNANRQALTNGTRIFSEYTLFDGTKIWIITEWDRSATTILLPSEY